MAMAALRLHLPAVQPRGRGIHPLRSLPTPLPPLPGEPSVHGCRVRRLRVRAGEDGKGEPNGSDSPSFLESIIEQRRRTVREQAVREREMRAELESMRAAGSPAWSLRIVEWLVKLNTDIYEGEVARLAKLEADHARYEAEWSEWKVAAKADGPLTAEDLAEVVVTARDAPEQATAAIFAAFIGAAGVSWVASLFGTEVGTLLPDPAVPTAAQATAWAAWTLPYAGASAAAAAVAGPWMANRGTFRFAAAEGSFYAALHPTAILSLAAALAYSQGVVYQGAWLLAFLRSFAGGGDLMLDPAAADDAVVAQAMGSLVAAPAAPVLRLVAGPAAVAATAALEAGLWAARAWVATALQKIASGDAEEAAAGAPAAGEAAEAQRPQAPSLAAVAMSEQEFLATAARVFASSAWLGAETLATHNLWASVGTAAVGLGIAMGAARVQAGPPQAHEQ